MYTLLNADTIVATSGCKEDLLGTLSAMFPWASGAKASVTVTVTIGTKEWPGAAPSYLRTATFEMSTNDADEVAGTVAELIASGESVQFGSHELDARSGHTSWGADSGPFLNVLLFVSTAAASGIIGNRADQMFNWLRSKHRRDVEPSDNSFAPLTSDQAIENARWFVTCRYRRLAGAIVDSTPGETDDLELVSDAFDTETRRWTIGLHDASGVLYRVTLAQFDGIPSPVVVERIAPKLDGQ